MFPPQGQSPSVFDLVWLMAGETTKGYMFLLLHETREVEDINDTEDSVHCPPPCRG